MDGIDKGAWWSIFKDPVLDGLERRVVINNQTVKQAEANYRAARDLTAVARASFFPTATLTGQATQSYSGSRSSSSALTTTTPSGQAYVGNGAVTNTYTPTVGLSWAPDLWGKIRRQVESDVASAQSDAATLANATLSAQAELATDYVNLRIMDEEKRLYDKEVTAYQRTLTITQNQYKSGTVAAVNVISAQSSLLTAQAQDKNVEVARQQYEHAIAMLVGVAPAELTITPVPLTKVIPVAPTDVPATLLQRRPDIAAAERTMKADNALVGVQVAAYYPSITLSGSYGFSASNLSQLFNAASSFWSYGASASETLLDFGARQNSIRQAKAIYDAAVASYRQTVLTAFQGVEDELVALRVYQSEEKILDEAAAQAERAVELYINEYKAGTVDYTTVVTAEATALSADLQVITLLQERQTASIALIEDLGGGWTDADLPKR